MKVDSLFILLLMIFLHIVDDYYLQGILAQMKQHSWWEKNAPDPLYKNDYRIALLEHAFSWTFMIMLPIMICILLGYNIHMVYYFMFFICNFILHAYIDNEKANKKSINLITDQVLHLTQIGATWIICFGVFFALHLFHFRTVFYY